MKKIKESGEVIHGPDQPRLTLDQWKEKLKVLDAKKG